MLFSSQYTDLTHPIWRFFLAGILDIGDNNRGLSNILFFVKTWSFGIQRLFNDHSMITPWATFVKYFDSFFKGFNKIQIFKNCVQLKFNFTERLNI